MARAPLVAIVLAGFLSIIGCERANPNAAIIVDADNYLAGKISERSDGDLFPIVVSLVAIPDPEQPSAAQVEFLREASRYSEAHARLEIGPEGRIDALANNSESVSMLEIAQMFQRVRKAAERSAQSGKSDEAQEMALGLMSIVVALMRNAPAPEANRIGDDPVYTYGMRLRVLFTATLESLQNVERASGSTTPDPQLAALVERYKPNYIE